MYRITCQEDIEKLVEEYGFLPFFSNNVKGFSIEEMCDPKYYFTELEGPWEWKGRIAVKGECFYGKFFRGKAGFVSKEWFPDFANYRRDGYDFDALCDEGYVRYADQGIYNMIVKRHAVTTPDLKKLCGYSGKDALKGFDSIIARLQMQTYVNIRNFVYPVDRKGNFYGWGIAQYTTPEEQCGEDFFREVYKREPEESFRRMCEHLYKKLPDSSEDQIRKLLKR